LERNYGEIVGKALYERRKELNLTQKYVAEQAGIHRTTLSKLESGKRKNPRFNTVQKIAQVLQLD